MKVGDVVTFELTNTGKVHTLRYAGSKEYGLKLMFIPIQSEVPVLFVWKKYVRFIKT